MIPLRADRIDAPARRAAERREAQRIIQRVAEWHGLAVEDVKDAGRKWPKETSARHEAIRSIRAAFPFWSHDEIGREVGVTRFTVCGVLNR